MNIYIVIPAHNEESNIGTTLESLISQTVLPKKVIVVNDNSTDRTADICAEYNAKYSWIDTINITSSPEHIPGSKVIRAFYKGLERLDDNFDIICKFDADLKFPENYLEELISKYSSDPKTGMVGGHCYINKNDEWVLEGSTGKNHIRGALKSYRKQCFYDIGMLRKDMGWDTVDELLAEYHGWTFIADPTLKVKHLKPTGMQYKESAGIAQGRFFYRLRLKYSTVMLRSIAIAARKRSLKFFFQILKGYNEANKDKVPFMVDEKVGEFIRKRLSII